MIRKYLNKSGKSGVKAYEILPSAIRVQFIKSGKWYSTATQVQVWLM